jgi:hypothetical protein
MYLNMPVAIRLAVFSKLWFSGALFKVLLPPNVFMWERALITKYNEVKSKMPEKNWRGDFKLPNQ